MFLRLRLWKKFSPGAKTIIYWPSATGQFARSVKNQYFQLPKNLNLMAEEYPLTTPTSDERTMAILSHILTVVPYIGILGPLVIYLTRKDSQFVQENAKESLNFQITVIIAALVSCILILVAIGILMLIVLGIANLVLVIVATIKASDNKIYRYPMNLRLIK